MGPGTDLVGGMDVSRADASRTSRLGAFPAQRPRPYRAGMLDDRATTLLQRANEARHAGRRDDGAEDALERTFGCHRRLAVYGTLAPGRENHAELLACAGTWTRGAVHGHLGMRDHPVLRPDPTGPAVAVDLLTSDALPAHWPRLDEFEGEDYRRVLIGVRCGATHWTVANLYAFVKR